VENHQGKDVLMTAVDFGGIEHPVYVEYEEDYDENGREVGGHIAHFYCPECTDGTLIQGGYDQSGRRKHECGNPNCGMSWTTGPRKNGIALQMG
jgi:hypothetical protein